MFFQVINLFKQGSVCVVGLRGTGKDMLMANVAVRRKKPYVSNIDYGGHFLPLELDKLDCGCNTYRDFISGQVKKYIYPYPDGTDIYTSDIGVYFPSQYCSELNRDFKQVPVTLALLRQLGDAEWHFNVQNLNRAWDKLRELSCTYIACRWCKVLFGKLVIQKVMIYDKYESCVNRLEPFKVTAPLFCSPQTRTQVKLMKQQYECTNGKIKPMLLVYLNKSNYDTRFFKEMLKNGK